MFRIGLFLLLPMVVMAQAREEKPLPIIAEEPTGILEENITGWSYSLDGQWMSAKNTIPPRGVSRDKDFYESRENKLGLDNTIELRTYPVKYGDSTLLLILKLYESGTYKYQATKSGWRTQIDGYYYLVPFSALSQLSSLENGKLQRITIEMIQGGRLTDVSPKKVLEALEEQLIVKESYDRNLIMQIRPYKEKNIAQYNLYSLHEIFPDVEGVLRDFTINGKSLYGSKLIMDYFYYEVPLDLFGQLFSLNNEVKYRD